jgi:SAM-dependent methyltransferase
MSPGGGAAGAARTRPAGAGTPSSPVPAPTQHDAAYFDYLEGVKIYNYSRHVPAVLSRYFDRAAANGTVPVTADEAGAIISADPLYALTAQTQRVAQELAWRSAAASVAPHREALGEMLGNVPGTAGGRLELETGVTVPDWYADAAHQGNDIHLQPYWGDELIGAIYERGGGIYRTAWRAGYGKDPAALIAFAKTAPRHEYARILDLGCAFGSNTLAFRLAYPGAGEVVGIDLSAQALRWAHLLAEDRGVAVTYSRRDVAHTGYPGESFDLITGFLLLHEMPPEWVDATIAEAFRLLRPGGHLMFLDIPRFAVLTPEAEFLHRFDTRGNGERYWEAFLSRDFPALLEGAGFTDVCEGPLDYDDPHYWGSAALMRCGEFRAVNRWTTHASRP